MAGSSKTIRLSTGQTKDVPDLDEGAAGVAAVTSGPAIVPLVSGALGMDSAPNFKTLYDFVVVAKAAMIAHGWLT